MVLAGPWPLGVFGVSSGDQRTRPAGAQASSASMSAWSPKRRLTPRVANPRTASHSKSKPSRPLGLLNRSHTAGHRLLPTSPRGPGDCGPGPLAGAGPTRPRSRCRQLGPGSRAGKASGGGRRSHPTPQRGDRALRGDTRVAPGSVTRGSRPTDRAPSRRTGVRSGDRLDRLPVAPIRLLPPATCRSPPFRRSWGFLAALQENAASESRTRRDRGAATEP